MTTHETPTPDAPADWIWRREGAMALVLALIVFGGYFLRASTISMRGEEPRRAQVAVEMIENGDWIVPREQGDPFLSRPPLQNWLIATVYLFRGERDCFGARFPSLVATLLMVLVVYGYARTCLKRTGALAAAAAFATFGEVLQECRMAETEALFTLLVSGSLLVWHWAMVRGWPQVIAWSLGYALMALGMLAKSLQAPFYFLISVTVFLVLTRQWRRLFSYSHLAGILVGAGVLAAWLIPFYQQLGYEAVHNIWMNDMRSRIFEWDGFLIHLVQFPAELLGCTLPWSPLAFFFLRRDLRESIGSAAPQVLFMTIVLVVGVPTCWLPPNAMTRYLLPLYPCLAVLLGFVVQRCAEAAPDSKLGIAWRRYLLGCAVAMLFVGLAVPAAGFFPHHHIVGNWAEPPLAGGGFCAAFLAIAWLTRKTALSAALPWRTGIAVAAVSVFMIVLFNGPVVNSRVRRGNDVEAQIAKLRTELPPDVQFVSLGHVYSEFPFFYRQEIKPLRWDANELATIPEGQHFCFNANGPNPPKLPFAWQQIKTISLDRNREEVPHDVLVIARRIPSKADVASKR